MDFIKKETPLKKEFLLRLTKENFEALKAIKDGVKVSINDIINQMISKCLLEHKNKKGIQE